MSIIYATCPLCGWTISSNCQRGQSSRGKCQIEASSPPPPPPPPSSATDRIHRLFLQVHLESLSKHNWFWLGDHFPNRDPEFQWKNPAFMLLGPNLLLTTKERHIICHENFFTTKWVRAMGAAWSCTVRTSGEGQGEGSRVPGTEACEKELSKARDGQAGGPTRHGGKDTDHSRWGISGFGRWRPWTETRGIRHHWHPRQEGFKVELRMEMEGVLASLFPRARTCLWQWTGMKMEMERSGQS